MPSCRHGVCPSSTRIWGTSLCRSSSSPGTGRVAVQRQMADPISTALFSFKASNADFPVLVYTEQVPLTVTRALGISMCWLSTSVGISEAVTECMYAKSCSSSAACHKEQRTR
jgi:hypothetical protein